MVIDDLDRIDPEHIFRILNVFAAHFDKDADNNKFNFDKVIISCDIENIRRIFRNRYGMDADFNGYIDKFFSKGIFSFQNKNNIVAAIPSILSTIKSVDASSLFIASDRYEQKLLLKLLRAFVYSNHLNLRMLSKFLNSDYNPIPRKVYMHGATVGFTIKNFRIMTVFEFLIDLLGSYESALQALGDIDFALEIEEHADRLILGDLLFVGGWNGRVLDRFSSQETRSIVIQNVKLNFLVYFETVSGVNFFGGVYPMDQGNPAEIESKLLREILMRAFRTYRLITT